MHGLEFAEQGRDRVGGAEDAGVLEDQRGRAPVRGLAPTSREEEGASQQQDGRSHGPAHASASLDRQALTGIAAGRRRAAAASAFAKSLSVNP
jgi:hypothetical protein